MDPVTKMNRLIQKYTVEETGSSAGDLALAVEKAMKKTSDGLVLAVLERLVNNHIRLENSPRYVGRKWFNEIFMVRPIVEKKTKELGS